ncbi:hypothetical protein OSB04_008750 [Centaurea solstitialis]|uniref:Uncharacterized protein n=1 Tax=Centaurea solstitialis TaxID=347529 RepID=A0AA38TZ59_9ASTR|nr:hypothetical protein OSB04_008750 [Centaurea solstitialis]
MATPVRRVPVRIPAMRGGVAAGTATGTASLPIRFFNSKHLNQFRHGVNFSTEEENNMNHCGIQQKNTFASSCEEMRNAVSVSVSFDKGDHMVCPKPRRFNLFNTPMNESLRPLRWHIYQPEPYESKAGLELLEIIFEKNMYTGCFVSPFFSGSPPRRVSNPLIQDTRFGDEKVSPVSGHSMIPVPASGTSSLSPPSYENEVGPIGGNFGNKPAVRIEGFNCLNRDTRRNCGISARA